MPSWNTPSYKYARSRRERKLRFSYYYRRQPYQECGGTGRSLLLKSAFALKVADRHEHPGHEHPRRGGDEVPEY